MGVDQRKNSDVLRITAYRYRGGERRNSRKSISLRISNCRASFMRYFSSLIGGQSREGLSEVNVGNTIHRVREPIEIVIPCHSKLRKWAFENAYMLILMAILFGITWIAIFIMGVMHHAT